MKALAVALVALSVGVSGCASAVMTPLSGGQPFAGTRFDAQVLATPTRTGERSTSGCHGGLAIAPTGGGRLLAGADLPLSFVADVALLPITIPCAIAGRAH